MRRYYEILTKFWGFSDFRPAQAEAIGIMAKGTDTLVLMPTGAGKSLLYQVPALAREGVCVVVTPLVALMKDQVDRLRALGINAAALHSGLTTRQIDLILDNASWGDLKFLYVAPERLASQTFRTRVRGMNVCLIAVDEAHCISQWGYDFRPSYLRIRELRELLPAAPVLALTASATPSVVDDIMRNLGMTDGHIVRSSFARPNLSYAVRRTDDRRGQLLRVLNNVAGAGIVYVRTRDGSEQLAQWLEAEGIGAEFYHGGLRHADRTTRQERWMRGERRVMVATNAFGMGIDKSDVRFVVHYDMPDSLEEYYQEAGRAGRDGHRAYAVLLTSPDDRNRAMKRFESEYPPLEKIREIYESLHNYLQVGIGDGRFASWDFSVQDFAKQARIFSGMALNALKILQMNGYLNLGSETDNPPRIMFIVGRDDLYKIRIERAELDHIIRTLLRLYAGLFHDRLVAIDVSEIASATGYTADRIQELLKQLWQMRIIRYVPGSRSPVLTLLEERVPTADVFIAPETYRIRMEMSIERLKAMLSYSENTTECRSAMIQKYFGESDPLPCGVCDICLDNRPVKSSRIPEQIMSLLREGPLSVKQIVGKFTCDASAVVAALDELTAAGKILTRTDGKLDIKR